MALFLDAFRDHHAPRTICDIGFGSGFLLNKLINKDGPESFFFGLDISTNNVEIFNARRKKGPFINSLALPLSPFNSQLPFRDSSINTLFCNHVLEHVPNDSELIDEIRRVLSQDGLAIIIIPINEERLTDHVISRYRAQLIQGIFFVMVGLWVFPQSQAGGRLGPCPAVQTLRTVIAHYKERITVPIAVVLVQTQRIAHSRPWRSAFAGGCIDFQSSGIIISGVFIHHRIQLKSCVIDVSHQAKMGNFARPSGG